MPENFKRAIGRPRQVTTDTAQSQTLDLTSLTDQEEKIIQAVIQKDEIERSILEAKISEVRKEIQEIRKAGALTAGDDQNAICARCKFKFMPFIVPWADHGQRCVTCKFRVCAKCRTQQPGGSWLCILCFKQRQEKQLTGEFMSKGQPVPGSLNGTDLLRASLRDRSHTRSGYEEADGVNYVQRPAKTREVDSDTEAPAASVSTVCIPEDWRGKRKLPTLDRVTSLKRENSHQVKWPTVRRQDSYSQAVVNEEIPFSPPKGNTDRQSQRCKDVSSHSQHATADTDPLEFRKNGDSDTSSVASFVTDSQYASGTNSVGSSEGSRSVHDTVSIPDRDVQTIVVRGRVPAVLPNKFRFRRSSSSLTESQRSDSLDSCSSYEKSQDMVESNISKSPDISRASADEGNTVKKTQSGGRDGVVKPPSKEDNSKVINSFGRNTVIKSESQDSFEDVYNSNANLFVQMMNNEESAKDGERTKDKVGKQKRLLPQRPGEDSPKVADGDVTGVQLRREQRDLTSASSTDCLSVPSIAVTNAGVEQSTREDEDEEDDLDELFNNHQPSPLLGSRSSLADSRESIYSVYSDAGEVNYDRISVTGEIMFKLNYNYKSNTLEVHIIQCKELAQVDTKHNRSDPYVKTYLLPDKSRGSKRKTRIKKHTLSPIFDEILKYQINKAELETRSLWVTVWHNDRMGRNDFLGEVTIPLDYYSYNDNAPRWYPLQERAAASPDPMMSYKGDLFISLKFVTPDMAEASPKKKSGTLRKKGKEKEKPQPGLGEIHVLVREAQNLTAMRGSAGSDPFCKGYLLPDKTHGSKQKTPVVRKTTNPQWQHILVFDGVDQCRLSQHSLELTIWDYERLSSNDFLGGVRLNLGQGSHQGKPADWMDARGEEIEAWQSMMDHPNEWVDVQLPLRVSMSKQSVKK